MAATLRSTSTIVPLCLLWPAIALAAAPTGYEVAKRAQDQGAGFKGEKYDSIMELYGPGGEKNVTYKMRQLALEAAPENNDTTMTLIRFLAPPDTKGTALLTHEKKNSSSESRWLYLSETRQVKQIGGSSKSASFKGSEFAYEDMTAEGLEKFDYKNLGEAKIDGRDCWKVEAKPKYQDSGYSNVIHHFDKENAYVLKSEFFDKASKLLKTLTIPNKAYKKFSGQWRATYAKMVNHQTKRKTITKSGNYKLGMKLSKKMFSVSQLQKQ